MQVYSRENSRIIEDQYSSPSQYLNTEQQKHIAKYVQDTNHFRDQYEPQQPQFYLHGESQTQTPPQTAPQVPSRRTWSQKAPPEMSTWSQQMQQQQQHQLQQQQQLQQNQLQQNQQQQQLQQQQQQQQQQNKYDTMPSWKTSSPIQQTQQPQQPPQQKTSGFILHNQNGRGDSHHHNEAQRLFPVVHATPPKPTNQKIPSNEEMMAPQSISFIGDEEDVDEADNYQIPRKNGSSIKKSFDRIDEFEASLGKLNITSGSRTYRIPSPTTRHVLADSSFQSMESQNENEKGFYISFDNESQPKRPKPPLRTKKSPKKSSDDYDNSPTDNQEVFSKNVFAMQETHKPVISEKPKIIQREQPQPQPRLSSTPKYEESKAMVIGDDESFDPVS